MTIPDLPNGSRMYVDGTPMEQLTRAEMTHTLERCRSIAAPMESRVGLTDDERLQLWSLRRVIAQLETFLGLRRTASTRLVRDDAGRPLGTDQFS